MTALNPKFVRDLKEGYAWQLYGKRVLERLGFDVRIDPLRISPDQESVAEYTDRDDLRVQAHSGRWVSIAVKSRKTHFTGPDDYPHPKCIVDSHVAVHKWDRVAAALVVSQFTRNWIVIPMTTRHTWRSDTFWTGDSQAMGHDKLCYWVEPHRCKELREFLAWLRAT